MRPALSISLDNIPTLYYTVYTFERPHRRRETETRLCGCLSGCLHQHRSVIHRQGGSVMPHSQRPSYSGVHTKHARRNPDSTNSVECTDWRRARDTTRRSTDDRIVTEQSRCQHAAHGMRKGIAAFIVNPTSRRPSFRCTKPQQHQALQLDQQA